MYRVSGCHTFPLSAIVIKMELFAWTACTDYNSRMRHSATQNNFGWKTKKKNKKFGLLSLCHSYILFQSGSVKRYVVNCRPFTQCIGTTRWTPWFLLSIVDYVVVRSYWHLCWNLVSAHVQCDRCILYIRSFYGNLKGKPRNFRLLSCRFTAAEFFTRSLRILHAANTTKHRVKVRPSVYGCCRCRVLTVVCGTSSPVEFFVNSIFLLY